jgi:hypothetical protein
LKIIQNVIILLSFQATDEASGPKKRISSTSKHETSLCFVDHFAFLDLDPDPDSNPKHCLKTKPIKFLDSICCMLSKGDLQSIFLNYRLSTAWEKTTVKRKK